MFTLNKSFIFSAALCSAFILSGCSTNKVAVSEAIAQHSAKEASVATFSPEQAVRDAEKLLANAKSEGLNFYSPLHLENASERLKEAREYLTEPPEDIKNAALMSAIAAKKYIEDAYKNKGIVQGTLKEALQHLTVLDELNAQTLQASEYNAVKETLTELIKEIEQGNIADASNSQADLLDDMAQVEIDTLKNIHLSEAMAFYEKASDIDADEYAAITYEKAEQILDASHTYIEKNYKDREGVKEAGIEALYASKKAYYVAHESEKLIKLNAEEAEKHALKIFNLFDKIHQNASTNEIEPEKLYSMADSINTAISGLKKYKQDALAAKDALSKQKLNKTVKSNAKTVESDANVITAEVLPESHQPLPGLEPSIESSEEVSLTAEEQSFDEEDNAEQKL